MIEGILDKVNIRNSKLSSKGSPIVISSRLRLARNLSDFAFPDKATLTQKCDILSAIGSALYENYNFKRGDFFEMGSLSNYEKNISRKTLD